MSISNEEDSIECDTNSKQPDQHQKGLSFFTADDTDTSSESDSDEDLTTEKTADCNASFEPSNEKKLPSPSTLFATVQKPKFLDKPVEDADIDWSSLSKRYEPLYQYSSASYPGETVDLSSAERTEATITGAPVKYKREISETKRHLFLHGKRSVDLSNTSEETPAGAQGMEKIF